MTELLKNIGLGIFVNGAYALWFTDQAGLSILAIIEGVALMYMAIKIQKRESK